MKTTKQLLCDQAITGASRTNFRSRSELMKFKSISRFNFTTADIYPAM